MGAKKINKSHTRTGASARRLRGGWRTGGRGGETREIVLAEKNQGEATNTIMRRERREKKRAKRQRVYTHRHNRRSRRGVFQRNKVTGRENTQPSSRRIEERSAYVSETEIKKASTERETTNQDVVMETRDIPWLRSRRAMWEWQDQGN